MQMQQILSRVPDDENIMLAEHIDRPLRKIQGGNDGHAQDKHDHADYALFHVVRYA